MGFCQHHQCAAKFRQRALSANRPDLLSQSQRDGEAYEGERFGPNLDLSQYCIFKQLTNSRFPCVFKIGHAHSGSGKARVENVTQFQVCSSYRRYWILRPPWDRERIVTKSNMSQNQIRLHYCNKTKGICKSSHKIQYVTESDSHKIQ